MGEGLGLVISAGGVGDGGEAEGGEWWGSGGDRRMRERGLGGVTPAPGPGLAAPVRQALRRGPAAR